MTKAEFQAMFQNIVQINREEFTGRGGVENDPHMIILVHDGHPQAHLAKFLGGFQDPEHKCKSVRAAGHAYGEQGHNVLAIFIIHEAWISLNNVTPPSEDPRRFDALVVSGMTAHGGHFDNIFMPIIPTEDGRALTDIKTPEGVTYTPNQLLIHFLETYRKALDAHRARVN